MEIAKMNERQLRAEIKRLRAELDADRRAQKKAGSVADPDDDWESGLLIGLNRELLKDCQKRLRQLTAKKPTK